MSNGLQFGAGATGAAAASESNATERGPDGEQAVPRRADESEVGAHSRPSPLSPGDANANAGDPAFNQDAPQQPSLGNERGQPNQSNAAANAKMAEGLIAFEVAAGSNPNGEDPPKFLYSSKPIERFELGRFSFEDGYMGLYSEEDAAEFEELVRQQPTYTVVNIRRLAGDTPQKRTPAYRQGVDHTGNTTDGRGEAA